MGKLTRVCRNCEHCKDIGRSGGAAGSWGRKNYFCENPKTNELPREAFGNSMQGFICFGENTRESRPQIKTAPKWCPERS